MPQEPPLLQTRWVLLTLQVLAIEFGGDKVWKPVAGVALWHEEVMGMVIGWLDHGANAGDQPK